MPDESIHYYVSVYDINHVVQSLNSRLCDLDVNHLVNVGYYIKETGSLMNITSCSKCVNTYLSPYLLRIEFAL